MRIYTSYFGNIKNIPPNIWPLSVARQRPPWYGGSELDIVAPSDAILRAYKKGELGWVGFSTLYRAELGSLDPIEVYETIDDLVWSNDVVLLCYERPEENCHRHILADWLNESLFPELLDNKVIEFVKGVGRP